MRDAYDSYLKIAYEIRGINDDNIDHIAYSIANFTSVLSFLIESGFNADIKLEFQDVWPIISSFNGYAVDTLTSLRQSEAEIRMSEGDDVLTVETVTKCSQIVCGFISGDSFDEMAFADFATDQLVRYFASVPSTGRAETLIFSVQSISSTFSLNPPTEPNYVIYVLSLLCGTLIFIGVTACIFNQLRCAIGPCKTVDNGHWTAVLVIALQIWYVQLYTFFIHIFI